MTLLTYTSSIHTMIDELVNQLVLADNTIFSKVTTGIASKACVHFTGNGENKYILFKTMHVPFNSGHYFYYNSYGSSVGAYIIRVSIGTGWDDGTKEVTGTIQYYYVSPYFTSSTGLETTLYNTRTYSHTIWLDKNGFFWNCWNSYSDYNAQGFLMCLEFLPASGKLYNDDSSSIIVHSYHGPLTPNAYDTFYKCGQYGSFQWEDFLIDMNNQFAAYKSLGNNKVYFNFPVYCKPYGTYSVPNYSTGFVMHKRFFVCSKGNLAVNDVLSYDDGGITRQYLVTQVGSANGINNFYFAIPYSNAATYDFS